MVNVFTDVITGIKQGLCLLGQAQGKKPSPLSEAARERMEEQRK